LRDWSALKSPTAKLRTVSREKRNTVVRDAMQRVASAGGRRRGCRYITFQQISHLCEFCCLTQEGTPRGSPRPPAVQPACDADATSRNRARCGPGCRPGASGRRWR
jgi:hypothetical protein